MRIVIVALLIVSFAVPAYARGKRNSTAQPPAADQQKKSLAEEKAYKDAIKKIPDGKPADPWNKMR